MSRFAISVLCVFVLVLVSPAAFADSSTPDQGLKDSITSAPSKLCHPKKPITCRADVSLSQNAPETESVSEAPVSMSFEQDGRLCFGPRWICRAPEVEKLQQSSEVKEAPVQMSFEQDGRLCFGPRWICRAPAVETTTRVSEAPVLMSFEQDGRLCFGPRWICRAPEPTV